MWREFLLGEDGGIKMIDMAKAIELFHEQYKERYGKDGIFEPGETAVVFLKNCTMILTLKEDRTLSIEFVGDEPFVIDESLDMYAGE